MRECKYRFLPEYANEKKRRIKRDLEYYRDDAILAQASAQATERIDAVLRASRRGLFTLDEAMQEIAKVDVVMIAVDLRFEAMKRGEI